MALLRMYRGLFIVARETNLIKNNKCTVDNENPFKRSLCSTCPLSELADIIGAYVGLVLKIFEDVVQSQWSSCGS